MPRSGDPEDLTVAGILGEVTLPERFTGLGVLADVDHVMRRKGADDAVRLILDLMALLVATGAGFGERFGRTLSHVSNSCALVLVLRAGGHD